MNEPRATEGDSSERPDEEHPQAAEDRVVAPSETTRSADAGAALEAAATATSGAETHKTHVVPPPSEPEVDSEPETGAKLELDIEPDLDTSPRADVQPDPALAMEAGHGSESTEITAGVARKSFPAPKPRERDAPTRESSSPDLDVPPLAPVELPSTSPGAISSPSVSLPRVSSIPPPPPKAAPRRSSAPPPTPGAAMRTSRPPPPDRPFAGVYMIGDRLDWGTGALRYFKAAKNAKELVLTVFPKAAAKHDTATSLQLLADNLEAVDEPTLLPVRGSGLASGRVYYEQRVVDGQRLTERLGGPLTSLTLLRIADQVLRALIALHQSDLVHGHLTPDNILVVEGERPDKPIVRMLGAGVAPILEEAGVWTRSPTPRGSFGAEYQPPEVAAGERQTKRSDFYAVGVLLYHMCVGRPFSPDTTYEEGFDDIPQLTDVIRRATSKDPAERYSDAAAMLAALDWLEVKSSKMNPHTQDIPLWMEHSVVGNIPVTQLNAQSGEFSVPPGTMVSSSGEISLPPSVPPSALPSGKPANPMPAAPSNHLSIPSIPQAAALPRGARPNTDDQSLWWLAAALTLVIIVMGLGLALMRSRNQQPVQAPAAPTTTAAPMAPAAAP